MWMQNVFALWLAIFSIAFGLITNSLLIWLVFYKTPKEMLAHSRILLQTCVFDISTIFYYIFTSPVWKYNPKKSNFSILRWLFMSGTRRYSISEEFWRNFLIRRRPIFGCTPFWTAFTNLVHSEFVPNSFIAICCWIGPVEQEVAIIVPISYISVM